MSVRIGVLFNHQHESLAVALQAILPSAEVLSFDFTKLAGSSSGHTRIATLLQRCDHVVSQDVPRDYGPLGTRALRHSAKNFHLFPAFEFGGFHPDAVRVQLDHVPVPGATGEFHSRIVLASYITGLDPEEGAALFNRLVFARLGYFTALADHRAKLLQRYAAYGIDLSAELPRWLTRGCFMYTTNRPKMLVFLDLARIACSMMGLTPGRTPLVTALPDPLAPGPVLPFLPELASREGMQPEGAYRGTLPSLPLTPLEFVEQSYKALQRVPVSCLRRSQGVADALAKLALISSRAAAVLPPTGATGLLSVHGTVVRADLASGMLVQEKLWPPSTDCADFTFTPIAGENGVASADIMGGVDLLPALPQGTVAVRRQDRFLSVEPARLAVPLNRPEALRSETFLPLSVESLGVLRHILSQNWSADGGPEAIPSAMIRIEPDFKLVFGQFSVDLLTDFPVRDQTDGYLLQTTAGPRRIQASQDLSTDNEILLQPALPSSEPDEAVSLPEFRTMADASFVLEGSDEILHPPLTLSTAETVWLYETSALPGGLKTGRIRYVPKLIRAADKAILVSRGLEGIVLDRTGVFKDYSFIEAFHHGKLPKGFRGRAGNILMDEVAWRDAPQIAGPIAVFCNPNPQNYYHWLLETALPLWTMAPYLPPETKVIMPGTMAAQPGDGQQALDPQGLLEALGLAQWQRVQTNAPLLRASDVFWMQNASLADYSATLLKRFRAHAAIMHPPAPGPRQRIFIQRKRFRKIVPNSLLHHFLMKHGFKTIELESMPSAEQIRLFQNAEMVVAAHGAGLANLIFCPEGTRVLELSPEAEFRPFFWMMAEKLGLPYGVLRCPTHDDSFNGNLNVDADRFRSLYRMVRQVDTRP